MTTTDLPQTLADLYASIPQVLAVVQGGSVTAGNQDASSDIDLYVYCREDVPVALRRDIAAPRAQRLEIDNHFAECGDEWIERDGRAVDVMFRPAASFEDHLHYLLERFEAHQGYSTAVWHNLRTSRLLFDREGWFARLQTQALQPYPDGLAQAIIALNVPLLSGHINSRAAQVAVAVRRRDVVAVNGILTKLLASYFDVLYALNRVPHPGEKRLLTLAASLPLTPAGFVPAIEQLLTVTPGTLDDVPARASAVIDPLLDLLAVHGQRPPAWGEPV